MIPMVAVQVALAAVLSAFAVRAVRWYALHRDVVDHPTERSSHAAPTPRGGGLGLLVAMVAAFAVARLAWPPTHRGTPSTALLLALGGVLLTAVVGWLDDHGGLSVRERLRAHVGAGALAVPLALAVHVGEAPWLLVLLATWWIFFTVSAINVVNFIDGIDGMIGAQAFVFGAHLLLLAEPGGVPAAGSAALMGASLGFLLWNWSPARIFLGDVGSGALGAFFIINALAVAAEGAVSPVQALLPLYPIFLDATVTLVRRARRGERVSEAHRQHLYQRLANGGWGHARVSALFAVAAAVAIPVVPLGWGAMLAYAALVALTYSVLDRRSSFPLVAID